MLKRERETTSVAKKGQSGEKKGQKVGIKRGERRGGGRNSCTHAHSFSHKLKAPLFYHPSLPPRHKKEKEEELDLTGGERRGEGMKQKEKGGNGGGVKSA